MCRPHESLFYSDVGILIGKKEVFPFCSILEGEKND